MTIPSVFIYTHFTPEKYIKNQKNSTIVYGYFIEFRRFFGANVSALPLFQGRLYRTGEQRLDAG